MTLADSRECTSPQAAPDLDPSHWSCCDDEDLAICGVDVSGEDWTDEDVTCPACMAIDARMRADFGDACYGCDAIHAKEALT